MRLVDVGLVVFNRDNCAIQLRRVEVVIQNRIQDPRHPEIPIHPTNIRQRPIVRALCWIAVEGVGPGSTVDQIRRSFHIGKGTGELVETDFEGTDGARVEDGEGEGSVEGVVADVKVLEAMEAGDVEERASAVIWVSAL